MVRRNLLPSGQDLMSWLDRWALRPGASPSLLPGASTMCSTAVSWRQSGGSHVCRSPLPWRSRALLRSLRSLSCWLSDGCGAGTSIWSAGKALGPMRTRGSRWRIWGMHGPSWDSLKSVRLWLCRAPGGGADYQGGADFSWEARVMLARSLCVLYCLLHVILVLLVAWVWQQEPRGELYALLVGIAPRGVPMSWLGCGPSCTGQSH